MDTALQTRVNNLCLSALTDCTISHKMVRPIFNKLAEAVNQALSEILEKHPSKSIAAEVQSLI
ncbi:hypothetical protein [Streptococcus jiangjianxini]|uniref:hypothetical protein n=1 Tax=Streptococcus jiangjianxini TaxID=3161189 RepID=UPI0032EDE575